MTDWLIYTVLANAIIYTLVGICMLIVLPARLLCMLCGGRCR